MYLLPRSYTAFQALAILKERGLLHEDMPRPELFLACAQQLRDLAPNMTREAQTECSEGLVAMLRRNLDTYQQMASGPFNNRWDEVKQDLARCEVFAKAELEAPYDTSHIRPFTSLASSSDYTHLNLLASAIPVTNRLLGDTTMLRSSWAYQHRHSWYMWCSIC